MGRERIYQLLDTVLTGDEYLVVDQDGWCSARRLKIRDLCAYCCSTCAEPVGPIRPLGRLCASWQPQPAGKLCSSWVPAVTGALCASWQPQPAGKLCATWDGSSGTVSDCDSCLDLGDPPATLCITASGFGFDGGDCGYETCGTSVAALDGTFPLTNNITDPNGNPGSPCIWCGGEIDGWCPDGIHTTAYWWVEATGEGVWQAHVVDTAGASVMAVFQSTTSVNCTTFPVTLYPYSSPCGSNFTNCPATITLDVC